MSIRITCIAKASGDHENPYVAILKLKWENLNFSNDRGIYTREEMYEYVKNGGEAWVYDRSGNSRAKLIALISLRVTKYVKTEADFTTNDNLLKLKEC